MASGKTEHAGRSILEMLWEQMDIKTAQLVDWEGDHDHEYYTLKGQCTGLAYALAKITHAYCDVKESMDAIREEAMERYEAEYGDDEDDEEP